MDHRWLALPALLMCASLACNAEAQTSQDSQATVEALFTASPGTASPLDEIKNPQSSTLAPSADAPAASTDQPAAQPGPSPTPPPSRPSETDVTLIQRCYAQPSIDADEADWAPPTGQPALPVITAAEAVFGQGEWSGTADLSAAAQLCWLDDALYLLVLVTDDAHVQDQQGETQFLGDEVEIVFDRDLRGDYYQRLWNTDDYQFGLSPGDLAGSPVGVVRYWPRPITPVESFALAARRPIGAGGNYTLEAALPWAELGGQPDPDAFYGLCLALSDNDTPGQAVQESLVSNCPDLRISDPTTWLSVRFTP